MKRHAAASAGEYEPAPSSQFKMPNSGMTAPMQDAAPHPPSHTSSAISRYPQAAANLPQSLPVTYTWASAKINWPLGPLMCVELSEDHVRSKVPPTLPRSHHASVKQEDGTTALSRSRADVQNWTSLEAEGTVQRAPCKGER